MRRIDVRRLIGFIAIAIIIGVLWQSPVLKPIKLFVVLLHEASHALAAIMTGGYPVGIAVLFTEGGVTQSVGGSSFWILTAGYLGSLVWGGVILIVAARTRFTRALAVVIGVAVLLLTFSLVRNVSGFAFGLLFAAAMIAGGFLLREGLLRWALRVIGLTSCLYATYDIASDVLFRPDAMSDARMLAAATGFPPFLPTTYQTLFWGGLWILLSVAGTVWVLAVSSAKRSDRT